MNTLSETQDWMKETLESQVARLGDFIMENITGEPSRNEGAIDTAIRLLGTLSHQRSQVLEEVMEMFKGLRIGNYKDWIRATKLYGGTKEEWNSLQTRKTYDEVLDDLLAKLKSMKGE